MLAIPEKEHCQAMTLSFTKLVEKPRRIMLMVQKAGPGTDATIKLFPHLDQGDILIDGEATFYKDTIRRNEELANSRYQLYVRVLVVKKVLNGPSIMPGGQKSLRIGCGCSRNLSQNTRRWQTMSLSSFVELVTM